MLGKLIKLKKNSELSSSSFPVSSLHVFIGSDKNCDIRILKAAPQHCIITVEEGKLATVRNLATNDPTLLNGSQMDGFDHNLVNKDIISVLDKRFMWEYPSSSEMSELDSRMNAPALMSRKSEPIKKSKLIAVVYPHRTETPTASTSKRCDSPNVQLVKGDKKMNSIKKSLFGMAWKSTNMPKYLAMSKGRKLIPNINHNASWKKNQSHNRNSRRKTTHGPVEIYSPQLSKSKKSSISPNKEMNRKSSTSKNKKPSGDRKSLPSIKSSKNLTNQAITSRSSKSPCFKVGKPGRHSFSNKKSPLTNKDKSNIKIKTTPKSSAKSKTPSSKSRKSTEKVTKAETPKCNSSLNSRGKKSIDKVTKTKSPKISQNSSKAKSPLVSPKNRNTSNVSKMSASKSLNISISSLKTPAQSRYSKSPVLLSEGKKWVVKTPGSILKPLKASSAKIRKRISYDSPKKSVGTRALSETNPELSLISLDNSQNLEERTNKSCSQKKVSLSTPVTTPTNKSSFIVVSKPKKSGRTPVPSPKSTPKSALKPGPVSKLGGKKTPVVQSLKRKFEEISGTQKSLKKIKLTTPTSAMAKKTKKPSPVISAKKGIPTKVSPAKRAKSLQFLNDVGEKFVVKKGNDISSSSVTKNKLPNTPHPKDKKKCSYLNTSGFQSTDNVGNQTKTPVHKKEIVNNKGRSRISLIQNTSKSCRVVTKVKPPARRMRSLIAVKISGDMDPMCGMGVRSPCVDIKAEMPEEIDILRALDLARKTDTPKRRESRRLKNLNKTAEYVFTSKRPTIHSKTSATNTPDNNIPLTPAASSTDKTFHSSTGLFLNSKESKSVGNLLTINRLSKQHSLKKIKSPSKLNRENNYDILSRRKYRSHYIPRMDSANKPHSCLHISSEINKSMSGGPLVISKEHVKSKFISSTISASKKGKQNLELNIMPKQTSPDKAAHPIDLNSKRGQSCGSPDLIGVSELMQTPNESLNFSGDDQTMLSPTGSGKSINLKEESTLLDVSTTFQGQNTKSRVTPQEILYTSSVSDVLIDKSQKIIGNSINSQSSRTRNRATPSNYVGVRDLMKTPKNLDESLNLIGVRELMLSPSGSDINGRQEKLVNSLETSKTSPSGVTKSQSTLEFSNNSGTLECSTPKPISPVKFADKKLNSSMEKENMATSSERKKRSGINILIEESAKIIGNSINSQSSRTRNRATPNYVGVRDLMKTPKNLDESLNLSGVRELMLSPSGSDINGHQEKLVNSLETSKTSPSGVTKSQSTLEFSNNTGTLESPTPKPISPVKFADKKLNSSMEKENMATSSERKKRSGINILIEESAKIIGNSINSQSSRTRNRATPSNYVGVRELIKSPKNLDGSLNLSGVKELMLSPSASDKKGGLQKLVNSLETSKTSPSGVTKSQSTLEFSNNSGTLESSTPKPISPVKFADKKLNSSMEKENMATSSERKKRSGINILIEESAKIIGNSINSQSSRTRNRATPNYVGVRDLMKTPKNLDESLNLSGVRELMLSPSGSDINGHQEKLVNSLETSKTSPSGVTKSQSTLEFSNNTGTLESPTPKPISPVKFADKKLNSSMEKENMATSSERKKRSGINILIEESAKIIGNSINSQSSRTRNRATPPNYVVVRQLMKTPKNLTVHSTNSRKQVESPNFIGVRKLLRTPKISPDKSLNLSGIDRLMSSASASDIDLRSAYKRKSDETSRTKRIKKGANINNLQNEGLEVEKTVKKNTKNEHESSPDLAGIRYLMSTPVHTKGLNSPKNVTDINEDSSTSVFKTPVNIGLSSHSAGRKAKGTISPLVKEEFAKRLDTEKKFIANFASKSDLSINFYQNLQKSESPRSEILGLPIEDKSVHNSSLPHVSVLGNSCEMNSELNCSTQLPGNNNIKNVCNWLKNTVNNSLNSTVLDETQEGCRNVEFSLEISSFASPCDKTAEGLNASSFANVSDIQSMSVSPTSRVSSKIDSSVGHTTRSQRTPKMSFNTNDSMLNVSSSESPSKKGQLKTISSPTLDIGSNLKKSPDHVEIIDTSIPNKVLKNCNAISNESSTSIPNTNVISSTEISSSSRRKARKSGVSLATSLGERLTPETCALNAVANVYDAVNTPESPKKSRHSIQKGIVQLAENSTPTSIFNNLCADKRIFSKPHIADYTNVSGIKRLFENAQKSSYLDVQGIKKLFQDEISPTKSDNVGENKSSVLHSNDDGLVCKVSKIQAKKYRKNKTTQETESVSNRRVLRSHQAVNEDELKIDKSIGKTENATPVQKYKRKLVPTSASSNMNSANTEITVGEANTVLEHDSDVLCRSNVPHKSKRGESPVSKSKAETVEHGQSVEKQMKRNRKKKDDSSSCEQSMDNSIRTLRNRSVNKRPHSDLNELEIIPTKAKKVPKTSDGLAASKRKDETSVISEFIPVEKVQVREIRVTRSKGLVTSTPQKGKGVKQSKELKRNIVQSPPSVRSRAKFQDSAPSESGDSSKILPSKKKGLKKQPKKVQFDMNESIMLISPRRLRDGTVRRTNYERDRKLDEKPVLRSSSRRTRNQTSTKK